MKTRAFLLVASFLMLIACQSDYGKILEAKKQIMYAGVENAPNHIKYTVKFEIYKPVALEEVRIEGSKDMILDHFVIKDLKTGLEHSDLEQIPAGKYLLTASIQTDLKNVDNAENIVFKIKLLDKQKTGYIKTPVTMEKPVYMP